MDLKVLASPPVLIGGAALGVLILVMNSARSPAATGGRGAPTPAELSYSAQMNMASINGMTEQARISAGVGAARLNADVSRQAHLLAYLAGEDENRAAVTIQRNESAAGIVQAQIGASAALAMEAMAGQVRIKQAELALQGQKVGAEAAKDIAESQMWGSAIGTVGSIASMFVGA